MFDDINLVVLAGRLAAPPTVETFDTGNTLVRMLLTVRTNKPRRRIDVIPVAWHNPDPKDIPHQTGTKLWVAGSTQRRWWTDQKHSRLQVVASQVVTGPKDLAILEEYDEAI